jgi:dTDP-6-deoxy-L-talose 4-dehydrogenase (NAD+)
MKISVTGATGFIGNHVIKNLLEYQGNIQIIASSRNAEKANNFRCFSKVRYLPFDVNAAPKDCFRYFGEPDALIHLAWEGLPNYKDLFHLEKNLYADYFFLKSMIKYHIEFGVLSLSGL